MKPTPPIRRWIGGAALAFLSFPSLALAQDLALTAVTPPASTVAGQPLSVDFNLTKTGGISENATVDFNASSLPAGVTIDSATGGLVSGFAGGIVTIGTFGDGGDATFTLHLTVPASVTDAAVIGLSGTAANETEVDPDTTNNTATADVTVARETSFTLTVDCTPDSVIAGSGAGNLMCALALEQTGPSDATGVTVTLGALPTGVSVDSADTTGAPGTSFVSPVWTIGNAPVGYTGSIVVTMTADSTASGDLTISATVAANETINGPVSDSDTTVAESAAAAPTSFLTTIGFTNGFTGTVTVSISCNNGVPLNQSFAISPSQPVNFIVDLLDFVAPGVECTISLSTVDGYVGSFLANSVDTGGACVFSSEPAAGEAAFDGSAARANTCAITAAPVASTFEVEKRWALESSTDIVNLSADIHIWCAPASADTGSTFGTVQTWVTATGDDDFSLSFYPNWDGSTTCYAQESNLDSGVESDGGCAAGTDFAIGDPVKTCTITNTVFFEGIPTLSQWGLALMALLMLGVGFVGLRRFA